MDSRKTNKTDPGQLALEDALIRVANGANPKWVAAAIDALAHVASRLPEVTADDVWDELAGKDVDTPNGKAMGNIMRNAARAGLITRTDRTVKTRRPTRNRGDVRVWRSRTFEANA
jgi:hypothetical protein